MTDTFEYFHFKVRFIKPFLVKLIHLNNRCTPAFEFATPYSLMLSL